MEKIDFVVMWVDDSDERWRAVKAKYSTKQGNEDNRFRELGTFKYWFRAVEQYAPWVNKIHLVTWGHMPDWLNDKHPKINIVKHDDFIPNKYLPTFSSHTIELNLHRINNLSETFVLFNDDVILNKAVSKKDFFIKGIPRDDCVESPLIPKGLNSQFSNINANTVFLINSHFRKYESMRRHPMKYFNIKYGIDLIRTITMLPYPNYSLFKNSHICNSYTKKTYSDVWKEFGNELEKTCNNRFRSNSDINQYIFRFWQFASGYFIPRSSSFGTTYELNNDNNERAYRDIAKGKHRVICLNDSDPNLDVAKTSRELIKLYEEKFPKKSSFEK